MTTLFIPMLGNAFLKTVEISLHASLIIAVLLVIRPLIKRHLPARWVYALWFIVVARLLLVEVPSLPEAASAPLQSALTAVQSVNGENASLPQVMQMTATPIAPGAWTISWPEMLAGIWLIGVVALLVHLGNGTFRWSRRLAAAPDIVTLEIVRLLDECRHEMGVRQTVRLVQFAGFASPSMTGLFRPAIILPEDFLERFSAEELRWVFLHELAHLKRRDLPVQLLCQVLQAVHWFNPLVWFAFACFRCDRELACDAHVLDRQASRTSREYGHALIKVAEIYPRSVFAPGFLGITEEKTDLHERVEKIGAHRRRGFRWAASGLILCALLAALFLTRQAAPAHESTAKIQVYKNNAYVPAEIEVIQSEDVVVPAIVGLGLDKTWAQHFNSNEPAFTPAEIMDRVSKMLAVKMKPDTDDVVYITMRDDNRQEAADIANAIAKQYVKKRYDEAFKDATDRAHQNLDGSIADLEARLVAAKENLEQARQSASNLPPSSPTIIRPPGLLPFNPGQAQNHAQDAVDYAQKNLDSTKAQMEQQIKSDTASNTGVRILAPAY